MKSQLPDSSACALAQKNFEVLPLSIRRAWTNAFCDSKHLDSTPWPERLIIEIANTCNLDCPMCRVGEYGINLKRVMSLERFKSLGPLFQNAKEVRLNGLGESTLVPDFELYIDELERFPVSIELITNGTGPVAHYTRLLDLGGTILFSWDAATPNLFEQLRRPARWPALVAQLTAVSRYASEEGRSTQICLLFTLQPANIKELVPLLELALQWKIQNVIVNIAKLADDCWLARLQSSIAEEFERADKCAHDLSLNLYLPDQIGTQKLALPSVCQTSAAGCNRPWKELVIRYDMEVQVCNMFNPYSYGNLQIHSPERVWRGGFAQAFRATINTTERHPYCQGCAYIGEVYARTKC